MGKLIDIAGNRFGKLVAIKRVGRTADYKATWLFKCDCGKDHVTSSRVVLRGTTTSCGCGHKKHGLHTSRLYRVWSAMRQRCSNPNNSGYRIYGGRGISVWPAWEDFQAFADWALASGYADDLEIDRIDTNGNYEPTNCRFVTRTKNARNTRLTTFVEYRGKSIALADIADETGLPKNTLRHRIFKLGMTAEEAVTWKRAA